MPFATHLLVPTDFSDASRLSARAAAMLAERLDLKVTIMHVHDPSGLRPPAQMAFSREDVDDIEAEVLATVQNELEMIRTRDFANVAEVDTVLIADDSPSRAICDHAEAIGADLIVISTHGRTGLKHLLIGSVAERVVRHSMVPVLSLRSSAED